MKRIKLLILILGATISVGTSQTLFVPSGGIGTSLNSNVGIGTSSAVPDSRLHIYTLGSSALRFQRDNSNIFGFEIGGTVFGLYDYTSAQYKWRTTGGNVYLVENSGSVGIGSTLPMAKLDINGKGDNILNFTNKIIDADNLDMLSIHSLNKSSVLNLVSSRTDAGSLGGLIFTTTQGWMDSHANIAGIVGGRVGTDATAGGYLSFWTKNGSGAIPQENMRITHDGNVGIGTTDPKGYKLAIAGKAVAEEVVVKLQANWPDYVFEDSYQLPSLSETEKYIKTNKHLPGVPSAKEIRENGVILGEMNAILLKKVEELTLYLLEQNKKIEKQQEQIDALVSK